MPEIAQALSWTDGKVRRLLAKHGGCPNQLGCWQSERPSYSKSYRAMQSGVHKIWTYGPTRETLRELAVFSNAEARAQSAVIGRLEDELRKPDAPCQHVGYTIFPGGVCSNCLKTLSEKERAAVRS